MLVFCADDPCGLKLAFILLPMLFIRQIPINVSWIDVAVFLLWIYDLTGCWSGINTLRTIDSLGNSTLCLLGYIAIRYVSVDMKNLQILLKGLSILISAVILLTILSFFVFQNSVESAGFEELYSFRFLFRPLGYSTNSWSTVLIATSGVILITYCLCFSSKVVRCLLRFLFVTTVFAILLSFSRGTYVALIIYLVLLLICVKCYKNKLRILGYILLAGVAVCCLFPKEVYTTVLMNTTISQQQSNKGRIQASQKALNVFSKRMYYGVGKGNYTLAIDKQLNQDSTMGYTSFAPNIFVQWSIEKGIIGIILYLFLALCIGKAIWKLRQNNVTVIAGCTLFAVFVKEMSLGTIYSTPICAFFCAFLLAMIQQPDADSTDQYQSRYTKLWYGLSTIMCISCLIFSIFIIQRSYSESYLEESSSAYQKGNYDEAIRLIEKTKFQTPYLICRAVTYMKCFEKDNDSTYLEKAEYNLANARMQMSEDVYIEYLQTKLWRMKGEDSKAYEKLYELTTTYPKKALYHKDLSDLLYEKNKKEEAISHMEKAIRLHPSILNMQSTKHLERTDSTFCQALKEALLKNDSVTTPTDYARYGYILYYWGDKIKAERYLTEAISALPNLSTPWYLLGEIKRMQHKETEAKLCMKKFCLLSKGAFQFSSSSVDKIGIREAEYKDLILDYVFKFENWYMSTINVMFL